LGEIKRSPEDLKHFGEFFSSLEEDFESFGEILTNKRDEFKDIFPESWQYSPQEYDQKFKHFLSEENFHKDEEDEEDEGKNWKLKNKFFQIFAAVSLGAQDLQSSLALNCKRNEKISEEHIKAVESFIAYSLSDNVKKAGGTLLDVEKTEKFFVLVRDILKIWGVNWDTKKRALKGRVRAGKTLEAI